MVDGAAAAGRTHTRADKDAHRGTQSDRVRDAGSEESFQRMKEEAAKRMKEELKAADAVMFDVSAFASATARQVCLMEGNPASPRLRRDTNTALRRRKKRGRGQHSSKKLVELVMRTDPCPGNRVATAFADRTVSVADTHRPDPIVTAELL